MPSWQYQSALIMQDLSFSNLVSNDGTLNNKLSTYAKIMLALCYQTHNSDVPNAKKTNAIVDELLQELVDEIRVQGRTAHLSYSSGSSPHPLPSSTQALALNALVNGPTKFSGLSLTGNARQLCLWSDACSKCQ